MEDIEHLKYPIGKFNFTEEIDENILTNWIKEIEKLPTQLREAVRGLTKNQFNTSYRPDGWTVKQVVHHIGDSHMNCIIRFKWTLTEDKPVIKPYNEKKWAETKDYGLYDINDSLDFITMLHKRLVVLLKCLTAEQLEREFIHPEMNSSISLKKYIGLYAWHGKHHVAHITSLRERNGW